MKSVLPKSHLFQIKSSRRTILHAAIATAALASLPEWAVQEALAQQQTAAAPSPNDMPGVALIGCGGQGRGVANGAAKFGRIVVVSDVDQKRMDHAAEQFKGATKVKDFRDVVTRKDVDIIINGTPDHWHTLINMAAMKNGKDVYSEKPLTLTIDEAKRLVKVARQTKRVLQTGSQQRSDPRFRLACELVRNGRIGQLQEVITVLPAGPRRGPFQPSAVPAELDWETWLGSTPRVEYIKERCHGSFRYWYEYSGGTMTDWGAHHNDIALWGMGLDGSGPISIQGRETLPPIQGGFTAASHYDVTYSYANGVTQRCISNSDSPSGGAPESRPAGELPHGVKFIGKNGWIFVTRGKIEASNPDLLTQPLPASAVRLYTSDNHMKNFFDCVRSREKPICDVEIGHRSVSVCHLGVIAIRLGRKLQWNPEREEFVGDKEAQEMVAREMRKPFTYEMVGEPA